MKNFFVFSLSINWDHHFSLYMGGMEMEGGKEAIKMPAFWISAWWSSSSWRPQWRGSRSLRWLQSFSSTVCRMPARMACWLGGQPGATSSESPDPLLYSENCREEVHGGTPSSTNLSLSHHSLISFELHFIGSNICAQRGARRRLQNNIKEPRKSHH
ncbi:uncharacterized protein LOC143681025 isoform X1 [Tamandua tetradactyla]|uniref:uncharacterized protein LOC143681025 isoform X1 n=1 Tax=Tamandua tetradactyla TaxID=48850 RepID=UPI0040539300